MSNLTAASCCCGNKRGRDNSCMNSILPIILLLSCCDCGNGGFFGDFFGGFFGNNDCGCGNNDCGCSGILPLLLILCLCGGSF